MAIVDIHGNPINKDVLKTPQTAKTAQWQREATHPSRGLTIPKLAKILRLAELGDLSAQADLFEDMLEKDGHIFSEYAKRKNALLTLDWSIEPPNNATAEEKKLAAMVDEWIRSLSDFEDITLNAAEAIGHGFSAQEIEWEFEEKIWLPKAFNLRPHRWFSTLIDKPDELRLNDMTAQGSELWPFGWLVHRHNAKSGVIAQSGIYRVLVWPYLFKNFSTRDLAEFLEIYGLPARIGTYQAGASEEEQDKLLHALVTLGHNAAGIIPDGTQIEFKDAAEGQAEPFMKMIEWCERTQSKVILGGTLTSQADGKTSTNALGKVHDEVRHDILTADARQLEGLYKQLIAMLLAVNGYHVSNRRLPRLVFDTRDLADINTFSTGIATLVNAGMDSIPVSFVHQKLGIPTPKNDEPTLSMQSRFSALSQQASTTKQTGFNYMGFAALNQHNNVIDNQTVLDSATLPNVEHAFEQLIAPLVKAIQAGTDTDSLLDTLADTYPKLNADELQTLLTQAFFVADVWGRLHADT